MEIEKIIIDGKEYIPVREYKHKSCLGCDLYKSSCTANKLCKCIGEGTILKREGASKPTLLDCTTIRSYEDACIALDKKPIYTLESIIHNEILVATIQLETISEAIRAYDGPIQVNANGGNYYFFPYFECYTEREIQCLMDRYRDTALWVETPNGSKQLLALTSVANGILKVIDAPIQGLCN